MIHQWSSHQGLNVSFIFQYVHYEVDYPEKENKGALLKKEAQLAAPKTSDNDQVNMFPPQVCRIS